MQQSWKRYEIVVFGDHGSCLTPCESNDCRQAVSRSALRAFYFVEGTAKAIQEFIEINAV